MNNQKVKIFLNHIAPSGTKKFLRCIYSSGDVYTSEDIRIRTLLDKPMELTVLQASGPG